jgi:hypothetical protein
MLNLYQAFLVACFYLFFIFRTFLPLQVDEAVAVLQAHQAKEAATHQTAKKGRPNAR